MAAEAAEVAGVAEVAGENSAGAADVAGYHVDHEFEEDYQMGRTLGQGMYATVKIAVRRSDSTRWAVKIVQRESLTEAAAAGLQLEVELLRNLAHPNIVRLVEVYDSNNYLHLVEELCLGGELFDHIVEKEHYSENEAKACLKQIVDALAYCHERNIVHRDIKPENLLYTAADEGSPLKLADFGLADLLNKDAKTHAVVGTPGYAAPEVMQDKEYGIEVDMWSLGVVLYILLAGYPPFYSEDGDAAMFQLVLKAEYSFPRPNWDGISEEAKELIRHLLVLDPAQRYTCAQVLADPWMQDLDHPGHHEHLGDSIAAMKLFNARRKFKGGYLAVRALQAMTSSLAASKGKSMFARIVADHADPHTATPAATAAPAPEPDTDK